MQTLKNSKKKFASGVKAHKVKGMKKIPFTSVVWREGKYYVAQCLNVDVASFGTTKTAALKNLKEALALHLEDSPQAKILDIGNPSIEIQQFTEYAGTSLKNIPARVARHSVRASGVPKGQ
jgi:predicted RNase H-like HicB family nuclease